MNRLASRSEASNESEFERLLKLAAALHRDQRNAAARAVPPPAHPDIAQRAYLRYLERGRGDGQDLEDWLTAERELTETPSKA
jgi:Protein of unknown function (DUF2934)